MTLLAGMITPTAEVATFQGGMSDPLSLLPH